MPLNVAIVTPEREVWSGEADFVLARSLDGDLGIMPGHAPFLGALGDARLVVQSGTDRKYAAVHGGFIEVLDDRVSILTEIAELADEIDVSRVDRSLAETEAALERESDNAELRAALARARTRKATLVDAGILQIG